VWRTPRAALQVLDAAGAQAGALGQLLLCEPGSDAVPTQRRAERRRFGRHVCLDLPTPALMVTRSARSSPKMAGVASPSVTISHPDKVLFPDDGITKGELAAYYQSVAPLMVPHIRSRPVTMERFPSGIGHQGFLQKDVSKGFPEWLERVEAPKKGGSVHYPLVCDERSLLWLANQNCITPHVWTSRSPLLYQPDICVFDLDPAEDDPEALRSATLAVRDVLAELGLQSWVKTSGSKGFHIVAPLEVSEGFDEVSAFALAVAKILVERDPDHLTLEFTKVDRAGRIYVDVGRNGYGATFAAAYAVRARSGAPVSAPCTWDEIDKGKVEPRSFTVRTMAKRIKKVGDLWADVSDTHQSLRGAVAKLEASQR
jgi:bifunctional non-homologous end joining protein LigD